jgi:uncharacterized membrane protein
MIERDLSPARVQAFSDGVIAIIITIMVLELHVPADSSPQALLRVWPTLASYALSYVLVAIYWVNHHHLFSLVKRVNVLILWANVALLFFLSLLPFFTAYVGQSRMAKFPVLCYCINMVVCGFCYRWLAASIARHHFSGDPQMEAFIRANARKNNLATTLNLLSVITAYWHPAVSMGLVAAVAVMYFVPGSWVGEP